MTTEDGGSPHPEDPGAFLRFHNDDDITDHLCEALGRHHMYHRVGERVLISVNPGKVTIEGGATDLPKDNNVLRDTLRSFIIPLSTSSNARKASPPKAQAQTVIALGESGSGKSTILMSCIEVALTSFRQAEGASEQAEADSGTRDAEQEQLDRLKERLHRTLRVADALGNARTKNNPDSSRMGKMIQVYKSTNPAHGYGFVLRGLMLETPRLRCLRAEVGEPELGPIRESAFHIFYYLAAHGHPIFDQFPELLQVVPVDYDVAAAKITFETLTRDFEAMGHDSQKMWNVIAAIWLLVSAKGLEDEKATVAGKYLIVKEFDWRKDVRKASENFGWSEQQELFVWAQIVYRQFFLQLIPLDAKKLALNVDKLTFVDICGYEVLDINHLQQLLINLCNEQLFDKYKSIATANAPGGAKQPSQGSQFVSVPVSAKETLLQSIGGSDLTGKLVKKLETLYGGKTGAKRPEIKFDGKKPAGLQVHHMDEPVDYHWASLVDDKTDGVRPERMAACGLSSVPDAVVGDHRGNATAKPLRNDRTVISAFRQDIRNIIESLTNTDVLFLRCIKAHPEFRPWAADKQSIRRQVVNLGVTATLEFLRDLPGTCVSSIQHFQEKYKLIIVDGKLDGLLKLVAHGRPISEIFYQKPPLLYYSDNARSYLDDLLKKRRTEIAREKELEVKRLEAVRAKEAERERMREAEQKRAEGAEREKAKEADQERDEEAKREKTPSPAAKEVAQAAELRMKYQQPAQKDPRASEKNRHTPTSLTALPGRVVLPSIRHLVPEATCQADAAWGIALKSWLDSSDEIARFDAEAHFSKIILCEVEKTTYAEGAEKGEASAVLANRYIQSCLEKSREMARQNNAARSLALQYGLMLCRVMGKIQDRYTTLSLLSMIPQATRFLSASPLGVSLSNAVEHEIEAQPNFWIPLAINMGAIAEDFLSRVRHTSVDGRDIALRDDI